jgi:hypothetical protein
VLDEIETQEIQMISVEMTVDEYHEYSDSNYGICKACGELNESFHEPDAEDYPCDYCEKPASMGLGTALEMELLDIV